MRARRAGGPRPGRGRTIGETLRARKGNVAALVCKNASHTQGGAKARACAPDALQPGPLLRLPPCRHGGEDFALKPAGNMRREWEKH